MTAVDAMLVGDTVTARLDDAASGLPVERVLAGWADLVRRVVGRPAVTPPGGST